MTEEGLDSSQEGYIFRAERLLSQAQIPAELIIVLFFIVVILSPIGYLFVQVFLQFESIISLVFFDDILGTSLAESMIVTIIRSLQIAGIVTIIDVLIGLPMAFLLARKEFPGKSIADTLVDIPLAVPTSALGFSILLFWGTNMGISGLFGLQTGFLSPGPLMIIVTHVCFSYPYVVRSLKGSIEDIDIELEQSARTLGASSFTAFRTITAPLFKTTLIAGAILAFTRSLGETGATLIVSGIWQTAPVLVISSVKTLRFPLAALLSLILVIISLGLLVFLRIFAHRVGVPIQRVWPKPEAFLSAKRQSWIWNSLVVAFFVLLVFLPATFVLVYLGTWLLNNPYTGDPTGGALYQIFLAPDQKLQTLMGGFITSLQIASLAVIANLLLGVPMAILLARKKWRLRGLLDAMVDIPLMIPSAALGFSILLLFGSSGLRIILPGFWMILIVHIVFTYPYAVRPLIGVIENLSPSYEEASRTLGASPLTTLRTVTVPMIQRGVLAAAIMTFTRSLSETGATLVVMGSVRTIPVVIVDWVESLHLPAAAFASAVLILLSFASLLLLRAIGGTTMVSRRAGGEM